MTSLYVEVGFVNIDSSLVGFLAEVFELEEFQTITVSYGKLTKLRGDGNMVLKVFVPNHPPEPAICTEPYYALGGLRFLSIRVSDLDAVIRRLVDRGGRVVSGPYDASAQPGVRLAKVVDPYGNYYEVSGS